MRTILPVPTLPLAVLTPCVLWAACGEDVGGPGEPGWPSYEVVDLGTLGGDRSRAQGINDAGQVVGYAARLDGGVVAFRWEDDVMTDLGSLGQESNAVAINDRGDVVGTASASGGASRAVIWRDGSIVTLDPLDGHDRSDASDIDNDGRVLGSSAVLLPEEPGSTVVWGVDGTPTDLGSDVTLVAMGGSGILAGCRKQRFACTGAILWQDGVITDIPWTSSAGGRAADVEGDIAIAYYYDGTGLLWENGQVTELRFPGATFTHPTALNGSGQVVGDATVDGAERAFLFDDGRWLDLDSIARETFGQREAARTQAHGINEQGQIAGARVTAEGTFRAILWNPLGSAPE